MSQLAQLRSGLIVTLQLAFGGWLILLGWGLDDHSGFFRNPERSGLVVLILGGAVAAIFFHLDFHPLRRGAAPVGGQNMQLGVLLLLSLSLLWFLPFADRREILTLKHNYWRLLGLFLCCIGVAVRLLALKALGAYFSAYVTLQPNHRLVQHGIYGSIRHPLYLSCCWRPLGLHWCSPAMWPRRSSYWLQGLYGIGYEKKRDSWQRTLARTLRIIDAALGCCCRSWARSG
jgi:protein-S-isoprenylcysteine O-methyltransferase Ste14